MAGKKKLVLEPDWCKGCGICVAFCPRNVLELVHEKIHLRDEAACILCGLCEMRCPDYALHLENLEE